MSILCALVCRYEPRRKQVLEEVPAGQGHNSEYMPHIDGFVIAVPAIRYLAFDLAEAADGVWTLEAMASTSPDLHAAVMAEVQQVLAWAEQQFPGVHGPVDEGMTWHSDLQVSVEAGGWHCVALTLTGTHPFIEQFRLRFGPAAD